MWRQSWIDLLFLHWPLPAATLRPLVPDGLKIQEFDGTSWIGVVPFRMAGVMLRPLPDLPWVSAFPELNVRIYVEAEGKPGVWFLSLDATNPLAVWAARRFFYLPYYRASMSLVPSGEGILYHSQRRNAPARFSATYHPTGACYQSIPGTLDHWLTERYCLYAASPTGKLVRNQIHHIPWPLQPAEAEVQENTMLGPLGLTLPAIPPVVHFARQVDVIVWNSDEVTSAPS